MIIKKLLTTFTLILASSLSLASEKISYSGRLTEASGAPISGPVSINLEVVTSTPAILCTITDAAVPLSNGVFHLEVDYATTCSGGLSLKETISNSVAASEELFIRVVDNTNSKTYPSQAITSTPLAVYALEAASVRAGSLVNTSLSGVAANCANNEVIAGDGSGNFKCISASTGSVTSVATGTGLTGGPITSTGTINIDVGVGANQIPQLDGSGKLQTSVETDPSVEGFAQTTLPTCAPGTVLTSTNGTSFSCATDDTGTDNDTTYTAGLGIDLTAGQFSIDASACAAGQRMIFGAPGFGCEDADAISIQGNDIDNTAPSDNDVLTWNNTTSKWEPRATASTVNTLDDLSDVATTTDNLFLGHSNTMGTSNTGVGITSLDALTTGNFNTSLGDGSLTATTQGSNNVALGYNAGASNLTGSGNVFLGNAAGENETGSNKLYIDNSNTVTPLIHGDFATDNVTINGTLTIVDGSQAANKVLTSDANGLATWSTLSGAGSVTSVDVTAPLVKAGTASDVDLSIPAATTAVDGYLTSTDWNIFNLKQDALPTGGTTAQYLRGDLTLSTFIDDVIASTLNGFAVGADSTVTSGDSVLSAFGKVQGQINDNNTDITTNATDIASNVTALGTKVDKTTTINGKALSSDVTLDTDDIAEGSTNLYFLDSRAKTAAVVNSTAGTETDQAASVAAMKSYVGSQTAASGDFMKDGSVAMTGSTKHSDGTEPLPSITFDSDTDTGIYKGAANAIAVSTGGNNSANFTSSTFHSGSTYGYSLKTTAGNQTLPTYSFNGDPDTGMYRSGTNQLSLATQGSNRLTILADGKIGIGVTDPDAELEINGQIKITGGNPGANKVLTSDANGLASWVAPAGSGDFLANGSVPMTGRFKAFRSTSSASPGISFDGDSNTGINTRPASPDNLEFVLGGQTRWTMASDGDLHAGYIRAAYLQRSGAETTPPYTFHSDLDTGIYSPGPDVIGFVTNGTERFRVNEDGDIGIGTDSPIASVDINEHMVNIGTGNDPDLNGIIIGMGNQSTTTSTINSNYVFGKDNNIDSANTNFSAKNMVVGSDNTTSHGHIHIFGSGNTSPAFATMTVGKNITNNVASSLMIGTGDTSKITMLSSSEIGIGTTSPDTRLVVAGGALCVGSDAACNGNADTEGLIYATTTTISAADYAEYFLREGVLQPGDIVGLNPDSGLARYYQEGDIILGVVSTKPGVLGNNKIKDQQSSPIALMGQVPFNSDQVEVAGRVVKTLDGVILGTLLNDGNMYLNISSKDSEQDRQIASLKLENNELNKKVEKIENEVHEMKEILCELKPNASICNKE